MKQAIGRFSRFGYCSTAESSHISHQVGHTWRSLESLLNLLMKAIEFQVIINKSMKILGWFRGIISHLKGKDFIIFKSTYVNIGKPISVNKKPLPIRPILRRSNSHRYREETAQRVTPMDVPYYRFSTIFRT